MAAKVISVVNNKGGVGKTTSTAFFGEILALFGKRVLLVDTDESGNLSLLFNHFQEDSADIMSGLTMAPQKNVSEIFKFRYRSAEEVKSCIYNVGEYIDILPASKRLSLIPDFLLLQSKTNILNNQIILKRALQTIIDDYDYIFIDTAPRNDILIVNSLMISDYVVIPVRSEGFSFKGFKEVLAKLRELQDEYEIAAQFLGAYQTAAETSTNIYKELNAQYEELLGTKNLPSIRKDIKVNEVLSISGSDLIKYTSSSNVLYDYCMLLIAMGILDDDTIRAIKAAYAC